jgi:hypothetical protein
MVCNFQTRNNKIKLLAEYKSVTRRVLFDNTVLATLISGKKYGLIPQNATIQGKIIYVL